MLHEGSRFSTSLKVFRPSGNQKECSSATPRSTIGCTAGSHEVGKRTLPSFSGGRPLSFSSSWAEASAGKSRAATSGAIATRSIMGFLLDANRRTSHALAQAPVRRSAGPCMASLLVSFQHVPDTHRFPKAMSAPNDLGRIAVMGAGAVGCYYGGMLARAGHDVTLIARPQHVEAVRKRGLRMETKAFDAYVPMQASAEASGARGAKLVLFSVKSTDTERAGAALAPYLERD